MGSAFLIQRGDVVDSMEAGYGHFVCSFWRIVEGDKMNKRRNEISFLRFGDLYNATKRTNDKKKWSQNYGSLKWPLLVMFKHNMTT